MISTLRRSTFDLATSSDFASEIARYKQASENLLYLDQIVDDTNTAFNSILLKRAPSNIGEICFDLAARYAASMFVFEDIDCMAETIIREIDVPSDDSDDVDWQFYDLSHDNEPILNAQALANHGPFTHSSAVDLVTRLLAFSIQLGRTS